MRVYTVMRPRGGQGPKSLDRIVFLSDGFCWPAFIFGPAWLLYRRMWLALLVMLVAIALLAGAIWIGWLRIHAEWIYVAMAALLGFEGNRLREAALTRRGFKVDDLIFASGKVEAERRYFVRVDLAEPAPHGPVVSTAAPAYRGEIVGLFPQPNRAP